MTREEIKAIIKENNLVINGEVTDNEIETHLDWIMDNVTSITKEDIDDYVDDYIQEDVLCHIDECLEDGWDETAKEHIKDLAFHLIDKGLDLDKAVYEAESKLYAKESDRMADERMWQEAIAEENAATNRWINSGGWLTAYGL